MKYYKAFNQNSKPFITWHLWANSEVEFENLPLVDQVLCLAEDDIENVFGVSPKKIVAGQLVNRTPQEMAVFESEFQELTLESSKNNLREKMKLIQQEIELNRHLDENVDDLMTELASLTNEYNALTTTL